MISTEKSERTSLRAGARSAKKITIICLTCRMEFVVKACMAKGGRRKFCSRSCKTAHQKTLTGPKAPNFGRTPTLSTRERQSRQARAKALTQFGPNHPGWKGGTFVQKGYRYVHVNGVPENERPIAIGTAGKNCHYVMEHRLVMARRLARPLTKGETVHHINGDKMDNRPENLELMSASEHSREHRTMVRQIGAMRQEIERLLEENGRLRSLLTGSQNDIAASL